MQDAQPLLSDDDTEARSNSATATKADVAGAVSSQHADPYSLAAAAHELKTVTHALRFDQNAPETPFSSAQRSAVDKGKLREPAGAVIAAARRHKKATRAAVGVEYGPLTEMGNHGNGNRFWPA